MDDLGNFNSALSTTSPTIMSYNDWITQNGVSPDSVEQNPDSIATKFSNWFSGNTSRMQSQYENYLMNNERMWDLAKINDARAWEEYMDSTKYQRAMKDIQNTGFNPLLALTGGSVGSTPASPTSNSAGSLRYNRDKQNQLGDVVSILGTAFKVAALFMMSKSAGVKAAAAAAGADLAREKWEHGGYQEHTWIDNGIKHKYHFR